MSVFLQESMPVDTVDIQYFIPDTDIVETILKAEMENTAPQ